MEKERLKELIIEHKERFLSKRGLIKREPEGNREIYKANGNSFNHRCKKGWKILSNEANLR